MGREVTVGEAWDRLEAALADHARPLVRGLKPGVEASLVSASEKKLKVTLPDELRATYTRHAAAKRLFPSAVVRDMAYDLIPPKQLSQHYRPRSADEEGLERDQIEVSPGVQPEYWHPEWIPFATNGAGDYQCIDLAPVDGGRRGQVIELQHEGVKRVVRAPSLAGWLLLIAERLDSGIYYHDPEDGISHAGESGRGLATAADVRARSDLVLVKTTKSGVEYWMKRIRGPAADSTEPPNHEVLGHENRYYLFYAVKGDRVVPPHPSSLDKLAQEYEAIISAR